ncbi:competence protein CoiA [Holzapfeliella sp. JNUCC 80]
MYAALVNNNLIYAVNYQPQKVDKVQCPKCLATVQFLNPNGKKPYFKHLARAISNDETVEHQQLKAQVYNSLMPIYSDVSLEKTLPSDKVRPDILIIEEKTQIAIEVQCSPLSESIHQDRHHYYRKLGIEDIWLVGEKLHLRQTLAKKQIQFLRYQKNLGFYLIELHLVSHKIKLKYHIMRHDFSTRAHYQLQEFDLDSQGFKQLSLFIKQPHQLFNYQKIPIKWHKKQKELETIKRLAYANGYNLKKLLAECYTSYRQPYYLSSETTATIKTKLGLPNEVTVYLPIALRHLDGHVIEQKKSRQLSQLFNS